MKKVIIKALVGSRAHLLNDEDSDYDYRAVYVIPTSEILSLSYKYNGTHWIEGKEDNTSYEIGHFLHLATKCNPSILEVLANDNTVETTVWGDRLKDLFCDMWNKEDAFNAFTGYSHNQRKKMLTNKDNRMCKYATAYIRTLLNLCFLYQNGYINLQVNDKSHRDMLLEIRAEKWTMGKILDWATQLTEEAKWLRDKCTQEANMRRVNRFLLDIRKEFWNDNNF